MSYHKRFLDLMEWDASKDERSQQTRIGPSGLGEDCYHCLGCQLAELPQVEDHTYDWASIKGHEMHGYMERLLNKVNLLSGRDLYLVEQRLLCGTIGDMEIHGTSDCYDIENDVVVDWKFPADYTMRKVGQGKVPATYLAQPHIYGLGFEKLGYTPKQTLILFFPIGSSKLSDAIPVMRPYDRTIGELAFKRANDIHQLIQDKGADYVIPRLKRKADCFTCPRYAL